MDPILRARLIQVLALVVFDFVVTGGLIACRNQSQSDTYFEFREVKSGFVAFIIAFRVTMNLAITYVLSKDAPTKSKGLFIAHSGFWESFAVMVGHGVNIHFVMNLLCLRMDISNKDILSPSAQVSHSDATGLLKNLTLGLSIASVIAVVAAWTLYWRFGPEPPSKGNGNVNQQSIVNENVQKDHIELAVSTGPVPTSPTQTQTQHFGPRLNHTKLI